MCMLCLGAVAGCADKTQETEEVQEVVVQEEQENDTEWETEIQETDETKSGLKDVLKDVLLDTDTPEVQEQTSAFPQMVFETVNKEWWNADGSRILVDTSYQRISVEGEGYEELAEYWEDFSSRKEESLIQFGERCVATAGDNEASGLYYYSVSRYASTRIDESVVSILESTYHTNGATQYGNTYYGYTYDVKKGMLLSWEEIVNDIDGFKRAATDVICGNLQLEYGAQLKEDYQTTVAAMWEKAGTSKWYLDASGMTFIFQEDEVTQGAAFATISFNQLAEFIKPEYQLSSDAYIAKLPTNGMFVYAGTDKMAHSLRLNRTVISEYMDSRYELNLGGDVHALGEYVYLKDVYLIRKENGKLFLLLTMDMASDDYVTTVYDISEGALTETDKQWDVYFDSAPINTERLKLNVNLDVLGSYVTQMDFCLDDTGKLVQQGDIFQVMSDDSGAFYMTTTKELPVVMNGTETTLPEGMRLRIIGTDNAGIAYFQLEESKQEGEIHYTTSEDSWGCFIDGFMDMEYFDMVPYAG